MAYILGIITTDGCLVEHKNGFHGLDITSKDKVLLERIKTILCAEHKIGKKPRGYRLQIRNRILYADLLKLGLTPRKTKTKIFPKVPKQYLPDFIRGCFDGDGSVFSWKEPRWKHSWQIRTVFYSGSVKFIIALRQTLNEIANLTKGCFKVGESVVRVSYAIADSIALYKFMYPKACDIYLERKKIVFKSFLDSKREDMRYVGTSIR